MIPLGFSFRETMSGSWWRLDAPTDERAIAFTIEARARNLAEFGRHRTWVIAGTIDADGLATRRAVEGTLAFKLHDEKRLPYRFAFDGDDGHRYTLEGQKDWNALAPIASMTTLPAGIYTGDGDEVGRATLRFDARQDLGRWLRSFRLRLGER